MSFSLDIEWVLDEICEGLVGNRKKTPYCSDYKKLKKLTSKNSDQELDSSEIVSGKSKRTELLNGFQQSGNIKNKLDMIYGAFGSDCETTYWYLLDRINNNFEWASEDLTKYLQNSINFEYFLYNFSNPIVDFLDEKQYPYRDHFLHAAYVGAFGKLLMRKWCPNSEIQLGDEIYNLLQTQDATYKFSRENAIPIDSIDWTRVIDDAWWLASIFHDIGWPYVYFHNILENTINYYPNLFNIKRSFPLASFDFNYDEIISILHSIDIGEISKDKLNKMVSGDWHGLVAALELILLKNCRMDSRYKRSTKERKAEISLSCKLASEASANHDTLNVLEFNENPLSFLLRICDSLHDWGRVIQLCSINTDKEKTRNIINTTLCHNAKISFNNSEFNLELNYNLQHIQDNFLDDPKLDDFIDATINKKEDSLKNLSFRSKPLRYSFDPKQSNEDPHKIDVLAKLGISY